MNYDLIKYMKEIPFWLIFIIQGLILIGLYFLLDQIFGFRGLEFLGGSLP